MDDKPVKYGIEFGRVSSIKQGFEGDSLQDQHNQSKPLKERLEHQFDCKIEILKTFEFTQSASHYGDKEYDLQPFLRAIEYCKKSKKKIEFVLVKNIERQTRGGALVYALLKQELDKIDVTLADAYGIISTQKVNTLSHLGLKYAWSEYSPSFKSELLEAERAKDDFRDTISKLIGAEFRYREKGYAIRNAIMGFINAKEETADGKRIMRRPHPTESMWFIKMFEMRAAGTFTDEAIVEEVNTMGFKSRKRYVRNKEDRTKVIRVLGNKPLDVKQLRRHIANPEYAGIVQETWGSGDFTKNILTKAKYGGLVSIDTWNKANRGKYRIIDNGDEVRLLEEKEIKLIPKTDSIFPYKFFSCPYCRKRLNASISRGRHGDLSAAYHCHNPKRAINGIKHYYRIRIDNVDKLIKKFVKNIKFKDDMLMYWKKYLIEEWNNMLLRAKKESKSYQDRVSELEAEEIMLWEQLNMATKPEVFKHFENEIEKVKDKKAKVVEERNKKEIKEIDIETAINWVYYYLDHLEELVLGHSNPAVRAQLLALLFDEIPSLEDLKVALLEPEISHPVRTLQLAYCIELIKTAQTPQELMVGTEGFEPPTFSV